MEKNEKSNNSIDKLDFIEVIKCLKECILIIKGYSSYNAQIYDTLKPLINNELIDLKPLFNNNEKRKNFLDDSNSQNNDIYELAYKF